uniref:Uncharacterized protein n=1 Tax=Sphaerodactylus townsendi TaxID=933632 RepID=A0ACB8GAZ2_9SAUR
MCTWGGVRDHCRCHWLYFWCYIFRPQWLNASAFAGAQRWRMFPIMFWLVPSEHIFRRDNSLISNFDKLIYLSGADTYIPYRIVLFALTAKKIPSKELTKDALTSSG